MKGVTEAIEFINDRPKPLAAYVFTTKKEVEQQFVADVSAGGMVVNDTSLHVSLTVLCLCNVYQIQLVFPPQIGFSERSKSLGHHAEWESLSQVSIFQLEASFRDSGMLFNGTFLHHDQPYYGSNKQMAADI